MQPARIRRKNTDERWTHNRPTVEVPSTSATTSATVSGKNTDRRWAHLISATRMQTAAAERLANSLLTAGLVDASLNDRICYCCCCCCYCRLRQRQWSSQPLVTLTIHDQQKDGRPHSSQRQQTSDLSVYYSIFSELLGYLHQEVIRRCLLVGVFVRLCVCVCPLVRVFWDRKSRKTVPDRGMDGSIWRIKWSRDQRRHVTRCGLAGTISTTILLYGFVSPKLRRRLLWDDVINDIIRPRSAIREDHIDIP